ncbi:MAG: hypothetical protein MMC33_009139 [Icmadophila ericetorum]|nr:hypothetical protein [Icmadophila ericetorum]
MEKEFKGNKSISGDRDEEDSQETESIEDTDTESGAFIGSQHDFVENQNYGEIEYDTDDEEEDEGDDDYEPVEERDSV